MISSVPESVYNILIESIYFFVKEHLKFIKKELLRELDIYFKLFNGDACNIIFFSK